MIQITHNSIFVRLGSHPVILRSYSKLCAESWYWWSWEKKPWSAKVWTPVLACKTCAPALKSIFLVYISIFSFFRKINFSKMATSIYIVQNGVFTITSLTLVFAHSDVSHSHWYEVVSLVCLGLPFCLFGTIPDALRLFLVVLGESCMVGRLKASVTVIPGDISNTAVMESFTCGILFILCFPVSLIFFKLI